MKYGFAAGNARRLPLRRFRPAMLETRKAFSTAVLSHIDAFKVAGSMRCMAIPKLFFGDSPSASALRALLSSNRLMQVKSCNHTTIHTYSNRTSDLALPEGTERL